MIKVDFVMDDGSIETTTFLVHQRKSDMTVGDLLALLKDVDPQTRLRTGKTAGPIGLVFQPWLAPNLTPYVWLGCCSGSS